MSHRNQDDVDDDPPLLTSHYELLESAMRDQLGPVAGTLVRVLCNSGPMTLHELAMAVKQEAFNNSFRSPDEVARVRSSITLPLSTPAHRSTYDSHNTHSGDVLNDAAIKEVIARLVLHRVVRADTEQHTYSVSLGYALFLRVLFPLIAQFFLQRYGEAGITLLAVFYELAAVPWDAALRLAIERRPALTDALRLCASEMERLGLITFISTSFTGTNVSAETEPVASSLSAPHGVKRQRETAGTVTSPEPCQLSVTGILREMFHDAILHHFIAERFADGGVAAAIAETFMRQSSSPSHHSRAQQQQQQPQQDLYAHNYSHHHHHHASESGGGDRPNGYPSAHARVSASLPLRAIRDAVSSALSLPAASLISPQQTHHSMALDAVMGSDDPVSLAIHRMCRPDGDALLRSDGTSMQEGPFRFRFDSALKAMRWDCCERIIFARHGVLGVRLLKLLLQHTHAEDRMLAEEAIATLPRTREALHAMMRDGFTRQQEIPRTAQLADRQPKQALYLWTSSLSKDVRPTCRRLIAQALHVSSARLAGERRRLSAGAGPLQRGGEKGEGNDDEKEGEGQAVRRMAKEEEKCQRGVAALEGSISALMHMMLVFEFY